MVRIRLRRVGAKGQPSFRVVAAELGDLVDQLLLRAVQAHGVEQHRDAALAPQRRHELVRDGPGTRGQRTPQGNGPHTDKR